MTLFHQKVNSFYKTAKRAKRVAAEFFLTHRDEIAFMRLEDVSERTGVSPATITRTATEIGFKGYPGLQAEVRKSLRQELAPAERLRRAPIPEGSLGYRESIAVDKKNLDGLLQLNEAAAIEKAVELLSEAPRVWLYGSRSSYSPISFLGFLLAHIRSRVWVMTENEGRLIEQVLEMEKGDLFLALTLPRYACTVLDTLEEAKERECRIISISDGPTSPLCQLSDVTLFVPYESYSFFNSTVSVMALFNALATGVNIKLGQKTLGRFEEYDRLMERRGVLFHVGLPAPRIKKTKNSLEQECCTDEAQ